MTIGIIEDDTLLHQALKTALQNAGYQTVSAYTKREALTTITGSESLLLIDIGLPDGNGLACYKKIREKAEIPAIFLTARDEETDMLTAFDTGADDYVVKPFSMKVLLKRIEAVIGRNNRDKQLACGEIILFPDKKQVYKNEKEIILTAREYQLLEYLMYNQGNVLTKENILEYVWGLDGQFVVDNTVSVTINRPGGIIEMRIQKNEMHAKITVKDNGLGIEKGEEHKIFQRFYRGKNVTTQKGYGIGLYLARKIIGLHGGFMIAKNRYSEKGLMIEINLPVC